eukprot:1136466-Pelagomonas_calceolata.AAC.1
MELYMNVAWFFEKEFEQEQFYASYISLHLFMLQLSCPRSQLTYAAAASSVPHPATSLAGARPPGSAGAVDAEDWQPSQATVQQNRREERRVHRHSYGHGGAYARRGVRSGGGNNNRSQ